MKGVGTLNLDQVEKNWNKSIVLYEKVEQLAFENPDKFEKYLYLVNEICMRRDYLKGRYLTLTETNIPDDNFYNGF